MCRVCRVCRVLRWVQTDCCRKALREKRGDSDACRMTGSSGKYKPCLLQRGSEEGSLDRVFRDPWLFFRKAQ